MFNLIVEAALSFTCCTFTCRHGPTAVCIAISSHFDACSRPLLRERGDPHAAQKEWPERAVVIVLLPHVLVCCISGVTGDGWLCILGHYRESAPCISCVARDAFGWFVFVRGGVVDGNDVFDGPPQIMIAKEGVPSFYVKLLANLEDLLVTTLKDKAGVKKMSATNTRSLNRMKLQLRKHNKG